VLATHRAEEFAQRDALHRDRLGEVRPPGRAAGHRSPANDLSPDLRSFVVGRYLIFDRPLSDGIEVVRVLHGARDVEAVLRG
jgi:toxin ParE1/3/4